MKIGVSHSGNLCGATPKSERSRLLPSLSQRLLHGSRRCQGHREDCHWWYTQNSKEPYQFNITNALNYLEVYTYYIHIIYLYIYCNYLHVESFKFIKKSAFLSLQQRLAALRAALHHQPPAVAGCIAELHKAPSKARMSSTLRAFNPIWSKIKAIPGDVQRADHGRTHRNGSDQVSRQAWLVRELEGLRRGVVVDGWLGLIDCLPGSGVKPIP